jgi:oligopeptide transport system ATP-binding protein
MTDKTPLLEVRDLEVRFKARGGEIRAVDGVSFTIGRGETLGLVGESGCGKSTTARAILRLEPVTSGRIFFEGSDIAALKGETLRKIYRDIQIIFQDPYASLNPRMTVGEIVAEPLRNYRLAQGDALEQRVRELFSLVGLDPRFINRYPHEFSGGQRQRIGVARALALNPRLIICDEPVSALDVSIQAQIINLLEELQEQFGFSYLFIAHDLSVVRHVSARVAVMYLGRIVDLAPERELYENPLHPYTQALLSAIPIPDPEVEKTRKRIILQGEIPAPDARIQGCRFKTRCPRRFLPCDTHDPVLREAGPGHFTACHLHDPQYNGDAV